MYLCVWIFEYGYVVCGFEFDYVGDEMCMDGFDMCVVELV